MEQQLSLINKTNRNASYGQIAIFWDMENCRVPSDVCPEDVAGNIRMALKVHPVINGAVNTFSAYGDFNGFSRKLREGCQRTSVKLIDVPNGRKDAADKAILVDMFLFALHNPAPSSIMLISGDADLSHALNVLGQRGYTIILVIPSAAGFSSALCNAGSHVWDWPSVARGQGFIPPSRSHISKKPDAKNDEVASDQSSSEYNLKTLKRQLVKRLKTSGGCLLLRHLPSKYQKRFGRPPRLSEYRISKLVELLNKMSDVISSEGKGEEEVVSLKECSTKTKSKKERKKQKINKL